MTPENSGSSRSDERARRALVVDDHPIVADALETALSAMRLFQRIEKASSLEAASRLLERDPPCNLVVLDLHLRDVEARETLTGLRERFPDVPAIIFSGDESLEAITMAFECGARGYVTKSSPMDVVKSAIRMVLGGHSFIPPEVGRMLGLNPVRPEPMPPAEQPAPLGLTPRQEQVYRLLLQGMPNKVIAARLDMAEGTAKAHLNTIYRVLGVRTRVQAILRARELGIT